ncbi:MAG TPA: ABC transporter permease [Blastocatellia bacterium]|jgi:putative ABC transport system permease protein
MQTLLQDLRYGARMLIKRPGFTLVSIISLALGIGANTAIFSVVNALLIRSLPYQEPDRIVLVWGSSDSNTRSQASATDVADWRAQNSVFEDVTTYGDWSATLMGDGEAERIHGMQVGDGYFAIMRGEPLYGRVFSPEENIDGNDLVIVLGYGLWQRRFAGDPGVVGSAINLSGRSYTIVGVMKADFRPLPTSLVDERAEFYRPVGENYDNEERSSRHLRSIARLRAGVSLEQAQAEMSAIAARLEQQYPRDNTGYTARLVTITEDTVGELRPALLMLMGAVVFVLLIACANVGNLLLARSTARQKEMAIRTALGAARGRIVRQLLTESVLLAILGGALGLLMAAWGMSVIESLGSKAFPSLNDIAIDMRVLGFTIAISLLTGIVFGLAPAMHASKPDFNESLKEGGRYAGAGTSRSRLGGALVVAEVAMALVLLICAGLMIRSVVRLSDVSPGFNPQNLLTLNASLQRSKYPNASSWLAFYNRLIERTEALPGVKAAGIVSVLPLSKNFDGRGLAVEDHPKPRGEEIDVDLYIATPGYLRAMEIPTLKGRAIADEDTESTPLVALINETMSRELWPDQDPIGKRIKFPGSERNPQPWRTIVGVVGDVKQYGLDKRQPMQIYLPEAQYPASFMTFVARTSTDPMSLIGAVRNEIRQLDKDQAVYDITSMEALLSDSMSLRSFSMLMLGIFAAVALTLAGTGIYGVISYSVTQRTREIGIRSALGADRSDILKMVVSQGMILALTGIAIGLLAARGATSALANLLYGVSAIDLLTFTLVPVLLSAVALLACLIPARRAMKVDPQIALRYE